MAYKNYNKGSSNAKSKAKKSKFSDLERLAYNMGQIERGLQNPNSKVTESFANGITVPQPKKKDKPML